MNDQFEIYKANLSRLSEDEFHGEADRFFKEWKYAKEKSKYPYDHAYWCAKGNCVAAEATRRIKAEGIVFAPVKVN